MTTDFSSVVAAMSRSTGPDADASEPGMPRRVTVLGGGPAGRALAAWLLAEGTPEVTLFTVYSDELESLAGGSITIRGGGPIGTYRTTGEDNAITVTSVLDSAVADADVLVVTGPVFKLRTYGMVLAPHLRGDQTLVVAPARTFGGLEMDWWLRAGGHSGHAAIVELPSLPFDVADGSPLQLGRVGTAVAGVRPAQRTGVVDWLGDVLSANGAGIDARSTLLHSSFSDGSGLVELPALMLGGPAAGTAPDSLPTGAVPVAPASFRRLVTDRVAATIDRLAEERRAVAATFGVRDLPSTEEWIDRVAGGDAPADSRPVPESAEATMLVREGALGSLVPLASAGDLAGVATPATDAMVETASTLVGSDLATAGRTLASIGLATGDVDELRRRVGVA